MTDLPYSFRDESLLRLALTHASCGTGGGAGSGSDAGAGAPANNERLEFLGDAVLDLVVAEELYGCHPGQPEGVLTELKAWVVSRRTLAAAARALDLESAARTGSGMRHRALPPSVLANLYEALLGAVYLDGGYEQARRFVQRTLAAQLERVREREVRPNPKQQLQQLSQAGGGALPTYVVLDERGRAHARAFLTAVELDGRRYPAAWGRTRKEAEQWAAHEALLRIGPAADGERA